MKQGWTYKKLGDLYPIIMGKTPPRGIARFWDTKKETHNLWVSIADLSKNEGREVKDTKEYISNEAIGNITKIAKGSLLVSFKLTLGKMAFAGDDLYTNEAIMSLGKRDDLSLKFLYYYFSSLDWGKIAGGSEKVKGKTLNKKSLSEIPIAYIPLPEQQRIVSRLDSAFAHIDELKANAEKQVNEARALFQKALSKAMEPKEGWEEKTLGEVCDIFGRIGFRGYTTKDLVHTPEEGAISLSPSNIQDGKMDYSKLTYISWFKYEESPEIKIFNGDILLVKTGSSYGKSALVQYLPHEATINPQSVVLKNCKINNEFFAYQLRTNRVLKEFDTFVSGTAIPTFSQAKLSTVSILFPPLSEQQRIVSRLDALAQNVKALEENQRKVMAECDALKQALLRKVFE